MIIKARAGRGGPALTRYLTGGKNEKCELLELRNLAAPNLRAAIFDMDMTAKGGRCQNHIYHMQLRAAPGEQLTFEQWRKAADMCAATFGMEHNEAALVLHYNPDGTTHAHLVINRVNPETFETADLWQNHFKHKILARQLEKDFGLRRVPNEKRRQPRDYSREGEREGEQARANGENVHGVRDRIRGAWEHSDSGQALTTALEANGFVLARGDKRDFVAVSETGGVYSLGKRTTGATAAQVRERMSEIDAQLLPDVAGARAMQAKAMEERAHAPAAAPAHEQQRDSTTESRSHSGEAAPASESPAATQNEMPKGESKEQGKEQGKDGGKEASTPSSRAEELFASSQQRRHEDILRDVAQVLLSETTDAERARRQLHRDEQPPALTEAEDRQRASVAIAMAAFNAQTRGIDLDKVFKLPEDKSIDPLTGEQRFEPEPGQREADIRRAVMRATGSERFLGAEERNAGDGGAGRAIQQALEPQQKAEPSAAQRDADIRQAMRYAVESKDGAGEGSKEYRLRPQDVLNSLAKKWGVGSKRPKPEDKRKKELGRGTGRERERDFD